MMMVNPYRLLLAETWSGHVVAELPTASQLPTWDRQINASGSLQAQVSLSPSLDDTTLQMLREPWRWTVLYTYGGWICQAGMLSTVDVDDSHQPPTATLHTTTLWDFFSKKRVVRDAAGLAAAGGVLTDARSNVTFGPSAADPANQNLSWGSVAARLVWLGTNNNNDGRFWLPITTPLPTPGTATITYVATDLAYVGQRITEITQVENGPEIEFSPEWTDDSHNYFRWRMRVADTRLGQLGYPWAWDYPNGACQSLAASLDGGAMTFRVTAKGQDNRGISGGGLSYADSAAIVPVNSASGWPWLETVDTLHASQTNATLLNPYARNAVLTNQNPIYTATATVRADGLAGTGQPTGSPSIDQVSVGDTGVIQVRRHPYLPDGQYAMRILGIGSGPDQWTAKLTLHVLGVPQ